MELRYVEARRPVAGLARRQWVELEDLQSFPAGWRDAGTAFLALALRLSGHAATVATRLERFLARTGQTR
ncbi:MAG: hypothetical protein ABMA64_34860, partial [Myxococcota bacterium]